MNNMRPHNVEPASGTTTLPDGSPTPSMLHLRPLAVIAVCARCAQPIECANWLIAPWKHAPEVTCAWCHEGWLDGDAAPVVVSKRSDRVHVHEECIREYLLALQGVRG